MANNNDQLLDNILLGFEMSTSLILGYIGGLQLYIIAKNFRSIRKHQEYKNFLNAHSSPEDCKDTMARLAKVAKDQEKLVFMKGLAVSGAFLMERKYKKDNLKKELLELEDKASEDKVKLYQANTYKVPKLFSENKFDEDNEGQNFYLFEKETMQATLVFPSSKMQFNGYEEERTISSSDKNAVNFMTRLTNSFLMGTSYLFYNRYSRIVYEGDDLNVFGVATYNPNTNAWEALSFINNSYLSDYQWYLTWTQVSSVFGIIFRGGLFLLCLSGTIWAANRLLRRIYNRTKALWRARFRQEDIDNQIPDAPPIEREGIDKIDIESYSCAKCGVEPRNIIFKPCKDCFLCKECYSNGADKFKCERCGQNIENIIQIYVSNQQH